MSGSNKVVVIGGGTSATRDFDFGKLAEQGLVQKYVNDGAPACYQYLGENTQCRQHYHLKCLKCGALIHLECAEMQQLSSHILAEHGFLPDPTRSANLALIDFAAKRELPFADMNGLFKSLINAKADKKVREFTVDGTHLNERGNALFANEVVKTLAKATQADGKPVFVIDRLDNVGRYGRLCKNFAPAFKFLQEKGWENLKADGSKFAIDGEKVFAFVQDAELKPWAKSLTEAHSAYIDIQLPLDGDEIFGVGRLDPRGAQKNFNGPDIRFYEQKLLPVKVRQGEFAMFLPPLGAHAPCCTDDGRKTVKKLVIKVLAE